MDYWGGGGGGGSKGYVAPPPSQIIGGVCPFPPPLASPLPTPMSFLFSFSMGSTVKGKYLLHKEKSFPLRVYPILGRASSARDANKN